jgi:hypothetical protein
MTPPHPYADDSFPTSLRSCWDDDDNLLLMRAARAWLKMVEACVVKPR